MTIDDLKASIDRFYDAVPANIADRDLNDLVDHIARKVKLRGWKRLVMVPGEKTGDPPSYQDPDVEAWADCRR